MAAFIGGENFSHNIVTTVEFVSPLKDVAEWEIELVQMIADDGSTDSTVTIAELQTIAPFVSL